MRSPIIIIFFLQAFLVLKCVPNNITEIPSSQNETTLAAVERPEEFSNNKSTTLAATTQLQTVQKTEKATTILAETTSELTTTSKPMITTVAAAETTNPQPEKTDAMTMTEVTKMAEATNQTDKEMPETTVPSAPNATPNPPTTNEQTTNAPITNTATTNASTTSAPETSAPIKNEQTTNASTSNAPTTNAPATDTATISASTTNASTTTSSPATTAATTNASTTTTPTTSAPTTSAPTTNTPTTTLPTKKTTAASAPTTIPAGTTTPNNITEYELVPTGAVQKVNPEKFLEIKDMHPMFRVWNKTKDVSSFPRLNGFPLEPQKNVHGVSTSCWDAPCKPEDYCAEVLNTPPMCYRRFIPGYGLHDSNDQPVLCDETADCDHPEYTCRRFEGKLYDPKKERKELSGICYRETFVCPKHSLFSYGTRTKRHTHCVYDSDCEDFQDYDKNEYAPSCVYDNVARFSVCCAKPIFCRSGSITLYGHPTLEGMNCNSNEDCAPFAHNEGARTHEFECTRYKNSSILGSLCCYTDISNKCERGLPVTTGKSCYEHSDCLTEVIESHRLGEIPVNNPLDWRNYCDEKSSICCTDVSSNPISSWMCPNRYLPLVLEPKCSNYDKRDPKSGVCLHNKAAKCWKGRCCPDMNIDTYGVNVTSKAEYVSRLPCKKGQRVPEGYYMSYCNNDSMVTVIKTHGNLNFTTISCFSDDECEKGMICVHTKRQIYVCVGNKTSNNDEHSVFDHLRKKPIRTDWTVYIIIEIITIIIFFVVKCA